MPQDPLCSLLSFLTPQGREEGWSEPPHQAVTIKPIQSRVICMQLLARQRTLNLSLSPGIASDCAMWLRRWRLPFPGTASPGEAIDEGPWTFPPALAGL